jgi:uncharacterized membrane protein YhaH (DUF805 family)
MNYYIEAFKKYVVFEGRSRRAEYWYFVLCNFIVSVVLALIGGVIHTNILSTIYALAALLPSLAVGVRRLHDTQRSGWWLLLAFIPIIGIIILIVWLATDSKPGANQYGPNPKGI